MTHPACSIVVRAFNEEKHIGRLLTGIMQQTVEDVEIILVDSGSTDATVAIASRFPITLISISPGEFTFGRSLNLGCRAATAEFLVFASAHVYPVYPDWIECLLSPFNDPKVALVYGKQRGNSSARYSEQQMFAKMYPDISVVRQTTPLCNNANAAVRRVLWKRRPYDEDLPGLEDLDWAAWALSNDHVLAYSSEAEVVHIHEESAAQVYNRYRREAIGLSRIQPEERFGLRDFLRLFVSNVSRDMEHAIRDGRAASVWWEVLWFRFMQFWGTYRGFQHTGPVTSELIHAFYYPREPASGSRGDSRPIDPIDYRSSKDIQEMVEEE